MLNIDIKKIKAARQGEEKVIKTAFIDASSYGYDSFRLLSPCQFEGGLVKEGALIDIAGEVTAELELRCDACGEPFARTVTAAFAETYSDQAEEPDQNGERDIRFTAGEAIDIAPEILSQLFLELPMKVLCRPDCRGLCQYCGQNLNREQCSCSKDEIDPRLEKLKEFDFYGQEKGV